MTRLERLNLGRELAGRLAVVAVFHSQRRRGRAKLADLGLRAPLGAQTDEHGQRQHAGDPQNRRPEPNRQPAHDTGRAVSDHHGVTP